MQIEKRFQSRLRRRRALLEARDTCSQKNEIFSDASTRIRWYQMVSGVGHLDISRIISTYLDNVADCQAKANEPYFATFWKVPRD